MISEIIPEKMTGKIEKEKATGIERESERFCVNEKRRES